MKPRPQILTLNSLRVAAGCILGLIPLVIPLVLLELGSGESAVVASSDGVAGVYRSLSNAGLDLFSDRKGTTSVPQQIEQLHSAVTVLTAPDLTPIALTAPAIVVAGDPMVTVTATVENQGSVEAGPEWTDRLYFSTDEVLDGEDEWLDETWYSETVAPGASYSQTLTAWIPEVSPGTYYLILQTDSDNWLTESDETNNEHAVAISVTTPDLVPTEFTAPAMALRGGSIEVTWSVGNEGDGETRPRSTGWSDNLYLSTDSVWDGQDEWLDEYWWEVILAPGESYSQTQTIWLPDVEFGDYYLILRVDSYDELFESNEANNETAVPITLTAPDLTPIELTAPATALTGDEVEVSWMVENQGAVEALGEWTDRLYLSTDQVLDEEDEWLDEYWRDEAVAPGGTYSHTQTIWLPEGLSGTHHLILQTDADGSLSETDETNNGRVVPITLTAPDLVPTEISVPTAVLSGQEITITWMVENQGAGEARPEPIGWSDSLYFSTDNVWDEEDDLLSELWWNDIVAPGAGYSQTNSIQIPEVAAGDYYLILRTDSYDELFESEETNNDRVMPIRLIVPDLVPTAVTPASIVPGREISVTWTVENQGEGEARSEYVGWSDTLYLSTDDMWDQGDELLGEAWWGEISEPVAPGASYSQTLPVWIPQAPPGTYYLILQVDKYNDLFESNDANNELVSPLRLTAPDLVPTELSTLPVLATFQQQIEVTWMVENQGEGEAGPDDALMGWSDNLYFSTDDIWDDQDTQIGSGSQGDGVIAPGESYSQTQVTWLPELQVGNYYLILRVDDANNLYESDEANNEIQRLLRIQEPEVVNTPWQTLASEDGAPNLGNLDFSPDGTRLVAEGGNNAFTWDVPTGDLRGRFTVHTGEIDTVDFSPVGDLILSGARDGTSRIWDATTRRQIRSFPATTNQPNPAVFSPDGTKILSGSGLNLPRLWDATTGEELRSFSGHTDAVNAVAFSPDGSKVLTGSSDMTAILWNVETGERLLTFSRHTEAVNAVAFSSDGIQALTASNDGSIRVWDIASGDQTAVFFQSSPVVSAVFSPDGKYIVSCDNGWPGMAYLWDISSGTVLRTFSEVDGGFSEVNGVAVSPDQTVIATSHSDGQVRLWQSGLGAIPLHPVKPLSVGSESSITLRSHGLYYFEINTEPSRNLLITLDPATSQAVLQAREKKGILVPDAKFANLTNSAGTRLLSNSADTTAVRVVIRRGSLPSVYEYDYSVEAPVSDLHAEMPIAPTSGGRYYVLVFAPFLSAGSINTSIRADYSDFHISDISPESGGSGGKVTVQIRGTGFTESTVAQLLAPDGSTITGEIQLLVNPAEMFVTFNLQDAAVGVYDIRIEDGEKVEIREDAFDVTSIIPGHVQVRLNAPNAVRPGREGTLTVDYSNPGNTDVSAPLLRITAEGAELRLPEQMEFSDSNIQLFATYAGGPVDVLPPGASGRISLIFRPTGAGNSISFSVSRLTP